jgi:hypothetical protein
VRSNAVGSAQDPEVALTGALADLAAQDVTGLPDAALRDQLLDLLTAVNQLHAQLVRRVDAFDRRGLAAADGCRTARSWLRAFGRLTDSASGALVKAARLLRDLPHLARAATAGRASAEHVGRVTALAERVGVAAVQDVDQILAEAAGTVDPAGLRQVCDRVRAHLDPDGPAPHPHEDFQRRGVTLSPFDGMLLVRGQLDPEGGAALMTALDAFTIPPADSDTHTPAQRRADALVELARHALVDGRTPTVGGVRPQIGILLTPQALLSAPADQPGGQSHGEQPHREQPHDGQPLGGQPPGGQPGHPVPPDDPLAAVGIPPARPPAWMQWTGPISDALAQRLACDADLWRVILDPASGLPLDVGRTRRLVPHWIRKALWARDRGCRFPGCHAPAPWTDAHHLQPWSRGGRTSVANLVLLCRFHHALIHEDGWAIHLDAATGTLTATRPGGVPYEIPAVRPDTGLPPAGDRAA